MVTVYVHLAGIVLHSYGDISRHDHDRLTSVAQTMIEQGGVDLCSYLRAFKHEDTSAVVRAQFATQLELEQAVLVVKLEHPAVTFSQDSIEKI
jgi:hypothetical protein